MANNYLVFSESYCLNQAAIAAAKEWLEREEDNLTFDTEFGVNGEHNLVVYAEECGEPEQVVEFLKHLLPHLPEDTVFTLTWAETCSKPRPGEFGGGAVIVRKSGETWMNTHEWVRQQL